MAVAAREVPDVTRPKIEDLRAAVGVEHGGSAMATDDVGPFCGVGMPMELAQPARFEPHRDTGNSLGNWELSDGCFLRGTALVKLALLRPQGKSKVRPFSAASACLC